MANYGNVIQIGGGLIINILIGFVTVKLGIFPTKSIPVLNKFLLKICFLPLMAKSIWQRDLSSLSIMPFAVGACANISLHLLMAVIFFIPFKDSFKIYLSTILPTIYVNYLIIGFPLFNAIWPENENVMISVQALSNDPISVTLFLLLANIYKIREANKKHKMLEDGLEEKFSLKILLNIILRVILNPIILGIVLGFIYAATKFDKCPFLDKLLTYLQGSVLSLCLFCVGGFLSQNSLIAANFIRFVVSVLLRHIVFPLLIALFCYAFKVNGKLSRQCIIMGCLPSASASFPLEAEADLKPGLASTLIFWTTIFCVPFQILWLFVMNHFNIFPE